MSENAKAMGKPVGQLRGRVIAPTCVQVRDQNGVVAGVHLYPGHTAEQVLCALKTLNACTYREAAASADALDLLDEISVDSDCKYRDQARRIMAKAGYDSE